MRNQFVYETTVMAPPEKEGLDPKEITIKQSFNIDLIKRAGEQVDGTVLVLLDDQHERFEEVEKQNKNGKKSIIRERHSFETQITLTKEDGARFFKLTEITENHE